MFYKWGHFAYRHRRVIPVLVIALIVAMQVLFGSKLGERLSQEGWEDPGADSTAAAAIEQETFGRDNSGDVIVLVSSPEGVDRQELIDAANAHTTSLREQYPDQICLLYTSPSPRDRG